MDNNNSKIEKLKEHGVLNPRPQQVKDELFQKHDFFDPQDLLQVKYEMVRRVQKDGWIVGKASRSFGLSRPSYYEAQNSFNKKGLPGLIPRQRGPKAAHKLSDEVMKFIEQAMDEDNTLRAPRISSLLEKRFDLSVHPRSIERALARRKKNKSRNPMICNLDKDILNARYEELRDDVLNSYSNNARKSQGLVLLLRQGMIGWLKAWSTCSPPECTVKDRKREYAYQDLPYDLRAQVVILLTNMALNTSREVITVC